MSEDRINQTKLNGGLSGDEVQVTIIGVGGAGTNVVDRLQVDAPGKVRMAAVNTDAQALAGSLLKEKCMIGHGVTRGLSTGGEAELGRKAALSDRKKLTELLGEANLVFLVAGLGGGTGSSVAPALAECAVEQGAMVIAFVTLPFTMEGGRRRQQAYDALAELRKWCDAVLAIPNDILLQGVEEQATVLDAFAQVDAWISRGIRSICAMLFQTGMINLDFSALRQAFITRGGKTLFGLGRASGEDYARRAVEDLLMCPLLHLPESATFADRLLVNLVGGADLSLAQVNEVIGVITEKFRSSEHIVIGAVVDERLQHSLEICVIGTTDLGTRKVIEKGFEAKGKPVPLQSMHPKQAASNAIRAGKQEEPTRPVHRSKLDQQAAEAPVDQEEFTFVREEEQRGCFDHTERNLFDGQDLDVPTYLRRGIKISL